MALLTGRAGTVPRAAAVDMVAARRGAGGPGGLRRRASVLRPERQDLVAAAVEFWLTTAFMVSVFGLVRWGISTAAVGAGVAETRLRVAVVSMAVGLVIVGFIVSRPGRFSGAHMNPAITLASFVAGRTPARRVLPYLAAQSAGSVVAAALNQAAWGAAASGAVVQPAAGRSGSAVAVVEAVVLAIIVVVMCRVTGPWLPWIMGGLFGVQGAILGTVTGGSANPARQLGPALLAGEHRLLAVYLIAPIVGAVVAAWAARATEEGHQIGVRRDDASAVTGTGGVVHQVPRISVRGPNVKEDRCPFPAQRDPQWKAW
ncbi:aquaporin [Actinoplanes sp. NPDC049599]|uniref:aquaporin n=1 Tax=Actinoplanes sp. NPDC049599 TaxID=3363903 RepID=UPI0037B0B460